MKKGLLFVCLIFSVQFSAQNTSQRINVPNQVLSACNNVDFENGTISGWTITSGDINGVTLPCNTCPATAGGISAMTTMSNSGSMWTNGLDKYSGLPVVAPGGGNYSLALNDISMGGKIQSIKQSFVVGSTNSIFTYQYLPVLQDGGHAPTDQPYFCFQVTDSANNVITCSQNLINASGTTSWQTSSIDATVHYLPWTSVAVNLSAYMGHTMTVQFIISDCNAGGHFGYVYIDASCSSPQITAPGTVFCSGTSSLTLNAPAGFTSYNWSGPAISGPANLQSAQVTAAGTYSVVTGSPCGNTTLTINTTTSSNIPPTITISGTDSVCSGQQAILNASGASSYTWSANSGGSTASTVSFTPSSNNTYSVTGVDANGCSNVASHFVKVKSLPVISVSGNFTLCPGQTTSSLTASGATTYTWSANEGGDMASVVTVTPTTTQVYTVNGTSNGCSSSKTCTVNVVSPVTITGNTVICSGASTVLTANGASTYTWSTGSNAMTVTVTPSSTTTYTLTGNSLGCVSSATISVQVSPNPTVTISGLTTICPGNTTILTASSAASYTWSANAGGVHTNTVSLSPTSTTVYTVQASNGTCVAVKTVTVNVSSAPSLTVAGTTSLCAGSSTTLTASGASNYTWSANAGAVTTSSVSLTPSVTTTYSVTGSNGGTCTAVKPVTITVVPIPTVTVIGLDTVLNTNNSVLTASGATTYSWSANAGSANTNTVNVVPSSNTVYSVSGSTSGCVSPFSTFTVAVIAQPIISTFAGTGGGGYSGDGGPATLAGLAFPSGLAVDKAGNVYIADYNYQTIRKVNTAGIISTVAGTGTAGFSGDGGPATSALITSFDVAVDSIGNLYLADADNNRIRKVNTAGIITTIAGTGVAGFSGDGGQASLAKLNYPNAITVDRSGNIYFVDAVNLRVRKIDATGIISTVAGNGISGFAGDGGPATSAKIAPAGGGIAVNLKGELFISDAGNCSLRKVDTLGIMHTLAGTGAMGLCGYKGDGDVSTAGYFTQNYGVNVDEKGNIFIADGDNRRVRKITSKGFITTIAGSGTYGYSGDGGPSLACTMSELYKVATDALGNVYVADRYNRVVRRIAYCAPSMITTSAPAGICPGDTAVLAANGVTTYTWSSNAGGANTSTVSVSPAVNTTYTVNGTLGTCSTSKIISVAVAPPPTLTLSVTNDTICRGLSSTLSASGASNYTWMPGGAGTASVSVTPSVTTVYTLSASNGGCSVDSSITITVNDPPALTLSIAETSCNPPCFNFISGVAPGVSYQWDFGDGTTSVLPNPSRCYAVAGSYNVKLIETGANGCSDSVLVNVTDTCNAVWPGDADENLIVDNSDLLPIGVEYGKNGPVRVMQGNVWQADVCSDWIDTLGNGRNSKYADCNGDGTINMNDTLAMNLNYGLTHVARFVNQIVQTTNPDIYLLFDKSQYASGDTVNAFVHIGSSTIPQTNFYGAAFNLTYDVSKVQPGTEKFWFNNSWVGNINQSKIKFSRINTGTGIVDASLVRITHTDTGGFGKVATLQFVLKTGLADGEIYFTVTNAIKTNNLGVYSNLNSGTDSVSIVSGTTIGQSFENSKQLVVYPNPATGSFTIRSSKELGPITVYNSLGETVFQMRSKNTEESIDVSSFEDGIYILKTQGHYIKIVKN